MSDTRCNVCNRQFHSPQDYLKDTRRFRICSEGNLWFECSCGSGLVLTYGEFEWYSPAMHLGTQAQSIFHQITSLKTLPNLPSNINKLQEIISNENSTYAQIENQLKKSPAIAMSVVETANSFLNAGKTKISTLNHAISYLGRMVVNDLILRASLQQFDFKTKFYKKEDFWREALACGRIAEYLSKKLLPEIDPLETFLAGSFCNAGKIVSAICFPEKTDEIFNLTQDPKLNLTWPTAEKQLGSYEHVVLGEIGAALWGFPDYVVHCINCHHLPPDKLPPLNKTQTIMLLDDATLEADDKIAIHHIIGLANQFMHWILLQPSRIDQNLLSQYAKCFNLDQKQIEELGNELMQFQNEG